ncbi:MAG: caspase family protein, partial [Saprospiraceae bacterium]|nr:caspase family protein [Saprospiraceae bacterium]
MKCCLIAALVFGLFVGVLNAQELTGIGSGVTRALVIGVSDYELVSDLNYAHRDAQLFADYLKSDAGGKVNPEHIRLLLNNKATLANIADAFDWLYAEAKKGDRVYVYFAGHGDVEKQTPWQHGFLLPYNSPVTNYRLRALPVEELDRLAVTLSTRGARVVIIADACRAGKLAGSEVQGPSLTAEEMSKKKANEIRILSCKPDQKSLEDLNWGGGRGLFSYYLLDGLKGLADSDADERVTLEELEDFMKPKVRAQAQSAANNRQDPIFDGEPTYWIATVDGPTLAALQAERTPASNADMAAAPMVAAAPVMAPPQADMASMAMAEPLERSVNAAALTDLEVLLDLLSKERIWTQISYYKLNKFSLKKTPAAFLAEVDSLSQNHLINWTIEKQVDSVVQKLRVQLNEQPLFYQVFNRQLALALHDFGQQMLNLYLEGDLGELEKRVIPDESARDYEKFPPIYSLAMRLLPATHFLQPNLAFEFHYFSGLALRLRMDAEGYVPFQFEKALQEELHALEID